MLHVYFVNAKESFHNKKNDFKNSLILEVNSQDHSLLKYLIRYLNWRHWINYSAFNIQSDHTSYPTPSILSTKNNGSKVYRFFCNKESLRWFFKANESNTHDKFNLNGFASEKNWRVDIDILDSLFLLFWI